MKIAVASLGNFHAKPFGPELQVKQMFYGRRQWRRTFALESTRAPSMARS
jgi:hypothetical protein